MATFNSAAVAREPGSLSKGRAWLAVVLGSALIGLIYGTSMWPLMRGHDWLYAVNEILPNFVLAGLCVPVVTVLDRSVAHAPLRRRLLLHLPRSLAWAAGLLALRMAYDGLTRMMADPLLPYLIHHTLWTYPYYWIILGVQLAREQGAEAERLARVAAEAREVAAAAQQRAAEARLHALEGQLNPHFLFNALNAISASLERDPRGARRLMADLGDVLRFSLDHAQGELVPLEAELAVLSRYLDLERARYDADLHVCLEASPEARRATVPALLLQPLAENAIRHGLRARTGPGRIGVRARTEGAQVHLEVEDDGVGLPDGFDLQQTTGIGLANTRERLALLYGAHHTFTLAPVPSGGTLVRIVIPARLLA